MKTAYAGFTSVAVPNWRDYATVTRAPSNYKDPAKIREYEENAMARAEATAAEKPLTGVLSDIAIFEIKNEKLHLLGIVTEEVPPLEYFNNFDAVVAIDAAILLRLARIDYIDRKGRLTPELAWAACDLDLLGGPRQAMRAGVPFFYDPVRRLVGSSAEENTDIDLIAKRFNLPTPDTRTASVAVNRAWYAYHVARLLGE